MRRCFVGRRLLSTRAPGTPFAHDYTHTPIAYTHRLPPRIEADTFKDHEDVQEPKDPEPQTPIGQLWSSLSNDPLQGKSPSDFFYSFPLTNFKKLKKRTERPRKVRMLASDFIDDSLYNPNYGYFPKQAEIFQTGKPFAYTDLEDTDEFVTRWKEQYDRYGKQPALQLWHTPVELFQPYYGEAIARYLLVNYKLNLYPYHDLIIYEIGGGNGTLMANVLDYIRTNQPEVYKKTRYKIVEISKNLSEKQKLQKSLAKHGSKVEIINKSIFDWNEFVPEPCFIVGLEVLDNLAHDMVKYDIYDGQPYQGYVVIDEHGDFHQFYTPELNQDTENFLGLRGLEFLSEPSDYMKTVKHPLNENRTLQQFRNFLTPFNNALSKTEFIPTRLTSLFQVLNEYFPEHQIVLSDFDSLPNASQGYNAPVVQTMLEDKAITTSTFMVEQGYFDIMFPTDFHTIRDLYINVCGKLVKTSKHAEFLEQWGDIEGTTTKTGENPMLTFYQNASFLHS
ncbi:hypothetical protein WICANDRAFT_33519 [Wickerhamomyces anomalus NRRL Y-366-8]|uniref:Protein arginine methyltransferase NDUFAF7 n=1 Tax=Wickerhamomyces anomalus (strain ATCC 58044 / CBS 1984 / NCYC 433 / NRRL Y-366-8) TaxID=683960 RepID=A0A1E3NYA0_WICAA|nr:uncharacterized protein WICANDRAFT_33519 [Wickerhamomyces anomalus NRRL Y-366-8]ODQ58146.1 hypothetical protein WICANDRAFT_33519 [Wickerhamomyces anomalus NRRL Y-366-8]